MARRNTPQGAGDIALSRPNYLTALALWPSLVTWDGGCHFTDARTPMLGANPVPEPHADHVRAHD